MSRQVCGRACLKWHALLDKSDKTLSNNHVLTLLANSYYASRNGSGGQGTVTRLLVRDAKTRARKGSFGYKHPTLCTNEKSPKSIRNEAF